MLSRFKCWAGRKRFAVIISLSILVMLAFLPGCGAVKGDSTELKGPKNVILFIGDGMGTEQVKAAGMFAYWEEGTLFFESFPYQAVVTNHTALEGQVTDSAAAATAMATGQKVANGVISKAIPGDEKDLETVLEQFKAAGRMTGLVTTAYITHATPAAFGAHTDSRGNYSEIASDYLSRTRPNLLFGGADANGGGMTKKAARAAGYVVVENREQLKALQAGVDKHVSGQFGRGNMPYEFYYSMGQDKAYDSLPHLSEMTAKALELLSASENGFFLLVEGGRIDHACHDNDLAAAVFETIEFDTAISVAWQWAKMRDDTLILVTADHETGGLKVLKNNGENKFPTVSWENGHHTPVPVTLYGWGADAEKVSGQLDNTDIYRIIRGQPVEEKALEAETAAE